MNQLKIESHIVEEELGCGNGGEAGLDAPTNYEQNVNKGADKKTEDFTPLFSFSGVWRLIIIVKNIE